MQPPSQSPGPGLPSSASSSVSSKPSAPTTHKLILVVLTLILVCLVAMLGRAVRSERAAQAAADAQAAATVAAAESGADAVAGTGEQGDAANQGAAAFSGRRPVFQGGRGMVRAMPTNSLGRTQAVGSRWQVEPGTTPRAVTAPKPVGGVAGVYGDGTAGGVAGGVLGGVGPVSGGVVGKVFLSGVPPREIPIDFGPVCGPLRTERGTTRHYVVSPEGGLANVVIFVHPSQGPRSAESTESQLLSLPMAHAGQMLNAPVVLDQVRCMFEPYVTSVQMTQPLHVRNSDPLLHNLHFTPKLNPARNIGQPRQGQVTAFLFERPETMIRIKCDVHPWMFAYVTVAPHPFVAVTDAAGEFRLPPGLPAGQYQITAQHLKSGRVTRDVTVVADDETRVELVMSVVGAVRQGREAGEAGAVGGPVARVDR